MRHLFFALSLAALSSPLLAQSNLIKNGDFESGMTGWTGGGTGGWPGVVAADLTGLGKSKTFSVFPGISVLPVNPYTITQSITLLRDVEYEFTADMMSVASANHALGPLVEVKIGRGSVLKWQRFLGGIKTGIYREKIAGRFRQTTAGKFDLNVEFQRPGHVYTTNTPRIYIDNIKLVVAERPSVWIAGDRKLGSPMLLEAEGTPSGLAMVFLSPNLLSKPFAVPGFLGRWELDFASSFLLLSGPLDAKLGRMSATLQVPNDKNLLSKPLYWQGIEMGKALSIGPANNFNITD